MKNSKLNSKLQVTLNQWTEILDNEMSYSADLRKNDVVSNAEAMIIKIKLMMS